MPGGLTDEEWCEQQGAKGVSSSVWTDAKQITGTPGLIVNSKSTAVATCVPRLIFLNKPAAYQIRGSGWREPRAAAFLFTAAARSRWRGRRASPRPRPAPPSCRRW